MRDVFHRYRADLSVMSPDARLFVRSIEQVVTIHVDKFPSSGKCTKNYTILYDLASKNRLEALHLNQCYTCTTRCVMNIPQVMSSLLGLVLPFFENDRSNLIDYQFCKKIDQFKNCWEKIDHWLITKNWSSINKKKKKIRTTIWIFL